MAVAIATRGLLLSVWVHAAPLGWVWLAASLMAMALVTQPIFFGRLNRFFTTWLAVPWLWLGLALLASWGVFLAGYEHNGALRHFGETLRIRSGLWAVLLYTVFLAMLAQRAHVARAVLVAAIAGTGLLVLALLVQPDYFSVLMLLAVMLLVALRAKNSLRLGLFAAVGGGGLLLVGAILGSPYRLQRLLAYWERAAQDPNGFGFEARMLGKATEQAGWWGFSGDLSATAMARLPASLEWYALNYLGLWLGNGVVVLVLLLLFALAYLIYRQSRKVASETLRLCIDAGLLLYVLNLLWSIAGAYAFIVPNAHYGLPFLSAGQMSLVVSLLLLAARVGRHPAGEGAPCE